MPRTGANPKNPGRRPAPKARKPAAGGRVRLHKLLADAGVGSRRSCEQLIEEGRVKVNGRSVVENPVLVDPAVDIITLDGRRITQADRFIYVMLNKPRSTVTTASDPAGRPTVTELVKHPSGVRLYPVGRLDYDTLGLLLLTNDGELANRLTHPRYGVHKTYHATVRGSLTDEDVAKLEKGIFLAMRREGETQGAARTGAAKLSFVRRGNPAGRGSVQAGDVNSSVIEVTLSEGRNRQVRRMLAKAGCHVKKLVRVQMGPLRLKGVRIGEWRELTPAELRSLRRAADRQPSDAGIIESTPLDKSSAPAPLRQHVARKKSAVAPGGSKPRPKSPRPSGDRPGARR